MHNNSSKAMMFVKKYCTYIVKEIKDHEECISHVQFADQGFLYFLPLIRTSKLCVKVRSRR